MKIFDTHAHFMSKDFENDLDDVLKKLKLNNVYEICEVSPSLEDSLHVFDFIKNNNETGDVYPYFYHSIGIHPDEIKNYEYDSESFCDYFKKLENAIKTDEKYETIAIGEIGLDYYGDRDDDVKINQKLWFIEQIKLAKKYDLPLIIHSRDACKDTLDIVKEYASNYKGIIHCFSYEQEIAKEYIDLGYYIGVGGVITFKNGRKLQETVSSIPIEKIVTETDSPYLSPIPKRGERNDSSNIKYIIEAISNIKLKNVEDISEILYNNAHVVYALN